MVSVNRSFRYASGRPAAGIEVKVTTPGTDHTLRSMTTDISGTVYFQIAPGAYDYLAAGMRTSFEVVPESDDGGTSGPVNWVQILGKPSTFSPSPHQHTSPGEVAGAVESVFDGIDLSVLYNNAKA